jgi:hypothetical protein
MVLPNALRGQGRDIERSAIVRSCMIVASTASTCTTDAVSRLLPWPKLGASRGAFAEQFPLHLMWERPKRSGWFESRAAVVNLFQGQHVGGGPEPSFQRGRIFFWQARTANFRSSGDIIVLERAMLNNGVILFDT